MKNKPENQLLIIFGASGDLSKRKLMPSLFKLYSQKLLPDHFAIIGAGRSEYADTEFRAIQKQNILQNLASEDCDSHKIDGFLKLLYFASFDTDSTEQYVILKNKIKEISEQNNLPTNCLYYLATPPSLYSSITIALRKNQMCSYFDTELKGWKRIVVEKPFGTNLKTAMALNKTLRSAFRESEIFRIDHYLGKETVQNIMALRFANGIFEPLWNRNYIDHIEITVAETLGVENRGSYFEHTGTLRDMLQNHIVQLIAFTAMEPPSSFEPDLVRNEIVKVINAFDPINDLYIDKNVIRGQYIKGKIDQIAVPGYREEDGIDKNSTTETFVAMRILINNWRWAGVPFYIRTGKRMNLKKTEIIVHFKSAPQTLFVGQCCGKSCNRLTINIQPNEGISLKFGLKIPGAGYEVRQVGMNFHYSSLEEKSLPQAYERLLLDALFGDATLFSRGDVIEEGWAFVNTILEKWEKEKSENLFFYPAGSWGPLESNTFDGERISWSNALDTLTTTTTDLSCPI